MPLCGEAPSGAGLTRWSLPSFSLVHDVIQTLVSLESALPVKAESPELPSGPAPGRPSDQLPPAVPISEIGLLFPLMDPLGKEVSNDKSK